jgi:cytochrome P450
MCDFMEKSTKISLTLAVMQFVVLPLLIGCAVYYFRKPRNKSLPPLSKLPWTVFLKQVGEGKFHRCFVETASKIGLVFEIQTTFQLAHHFMICDSSLARTVLEGDKSSHIPPGIKRSIIKVFDKLTGNCPNILSKQTHGEGWEWARKNVAPAFSNTNLYKRLPEIQQKTSEFTTVLDQHIADDMPLNNFTEWMVSK